MDGGFAIILLVALTLSIGFSLLQHRVYTRAAERLKDAYLGRKNIFLVSGRGRGVLRGAIVLLVIDAGSKQVVAAEAMIGSTVLARFRPRPELLGASASAAERAADRKLRDAVKAAVEQYRIVRTGVAGKPALR